jgi:hypothetical protein
MKRTIQMFSNYAPVLFLMLILPAFIQAQISITNNDMPSAGDSVRFSNTGIIQGFDYTATGENFTWDFPDLTPLVQTVDTFVAVNTVPFVYQVFFFGTNLAQPITAIDLVPGAPITDAYRFFRNSSASFNDEGFAFTVNDIPVPLRFDDPDIIYKFPVNYGNADSSFSGVEFGLPNLGFISIDRKRVNTADGWGTLTTSFGTFDVLRLKSRVIENDSIYIDSLDFGTSLQRDYIEYKWLANGFKAPLLQITEEGPLVTAIWMDSIFDPTVNIAEISSRNKIELFPNPFSESTTLSFDNQDGGEIAVSIFDLTGKRVFTVHEGFLAAGKHKMTIHRLDAGLQKGFYLLKIESPAGIATKKMIIQ